MKKIIKIFLITTTLVLNAIMVNAQRFCYVDTEYILDKLPEYKSAQNKLNQYVKNWQKEIKDKTLKINALYKKLEAEQVLLPVEERKKREEEIKKKEIELKQFKDKKFGENGEMFRKRTELLRAIQDKVFNAIQQLGEEEAMDFVLDKAAGNLLFTNAKFDRSDEVLDILGIAVEKEEQKNKQNSNENNNSDK